MESWILKGPEISELVAEERDGRAQEHNRTAIVIPTFRREAVLREHLRRLSRQSPGSFDVVLVYGPEDSIVDETFGLNVLHVKRKGDIGSAGGFYLGEKICLRDGYRHVILADDDCFPKSENLVEMIAAELDRGAGAVFPKIIPGPGTEGKTRWIISQYGGIRMDMLRKTGLSYLPFYLSGEDIELYDRIAGAGAEIAYVDALAEHPPLAFLLMLPPDKSFLYYRNTLIWRMLRGRYPQTIGSDFFFLLLGVGIGFCNQELGKTIVNGVIKGSTLEFKTGKTRAPAKKPQAEHKILVKLDSSHDFEDDPVSRKGKPWILKRIKAGIRNLKLIPSCFGKDILLPEIVGIADLPLVLVARSVTCKSEGKLQTISENNAFWFSPVYLAVFALAVPAVFLASVGLVSYGVLKKAYKGISSDGYGL